MVIFKNKNKGTFEEMETLKTFCRLTLNNATTGLKN